MSHPGCATPTVLQDLNTNKYKSRQNLLIYKIGKSLRKSVTSVLNATPVILAKGAFEEKKHDVDLDEVKKRKRMTEFNQWKEQEEEITYTTYVRRDRTYQPQTTSKHIACNKSFILSTHNYRLASETLLCYCTGA